MIRQKRGQAAMEFLMTYGWAILVVLIAIGALAYFGVLNPSRFLPASCTLTPGLSCEEFKVNTTTVAIRVSNGIGKDLTTFTLNVSSAATNCANAGATAAGGLNDGEIELLLLRCASVLTAGSRFKEDLNLYWIESGTSLGGHTRTGQIAVEVEAT